MKKEDGDNLIFSLINGNDQTVNIIDFHRFTDTARTILW
jgi:hypothetical protein